MYVSILKNVYMYIRTYVHVYIWVNALVLKDERVPEFLTYRSIGSSCNG